MPFFFKDMTRYESFLRQLNYYGFLRINHGKSGGPDNGAYYHECFLQGRPDLVAIMPRLIKSESSVRRTFDPTTAPNLSALSPIAMDPSSLEAKSSTMTESSSHLSSAETTVVIDNPLPLVRRQCTQYPSADSVWDPLPLDSIFLPNDGGQAKVKVAAVPRQSAQTSKVKDSRNALWPLDQQCIPRDGEPFKSSLPPPPLDCPFGSDATPAIPVAGESTMEYATQSRSRSTAASSKRATDTYLEGMSNKRQYNPSLAYDMASDPWYHELVRLNCYNSNTESIESTAPLRCLPLTWDKRPYTRLHDSTASMARISCEHRAQEELKEFLRGVPSHFWEY